MTKIKNRLKYLIASMKRICYDLNNRRVKKNNMIMNKEGILNVRDLACYIKCRFFDRHGKKISPIKLQKSLYFCFAYWGGFVLKSKDTEEEIEENPYLFKAVFKAWTYGPVIPTIYHEEQAGTLNDNITEYELFKDNDFLKETINSLLDDLFEISDFKLVNLAHSDNCWKNNFDMNAVKHDTIIDCDDIINEYAIKC